MAKFELYSACMTFILFHGMAMESTETDKETPENSIYWWTFYRVDDRYVWGYYEVKCAKAVVSHRLQHKVWQCYSLLHVTAYILLHVISSWRYWLKVSKNRHGNEQVHFIHLKISSNIYLFFALEYNLVSLTVKSAARLVLVKKWSPPVLYLLCVHLPLLPPSLFSSCMYAVKIVKVRRLPCP